MVIILLIYLVGMLLTQSMIANSNIPDDKLNPSNLTPLWALIWPIFWLKTIPFFIELQCKDKE